MMSLGCIGQRALVPAGGAASVVTTLFLWTGEQSSAKFSTRAVSKISQAANRNRYVFSKHRIAFSTDASSKATTTTTEAAAKKSGGFVEWYEGHLNTRPVLTKMITGSILWGVGDAVAQIVPQVSPSNEEKKESVDFPRTGRAVFFGFALHAPTSHVHFNFLEWLTNRIGVTGLGITVFKTVMEQVGNLIYWHCLFLFN
jgi:hypothetical protein